ILPAMKAARHSTLKNALEFKRAGGIVLAAGALPEASDSIGRGDRKVSAMVKEIFPDGVTNNVFQKLPERDYDGPGYIQHRRIGFRDLYAVYNAPQEKICRFRATGKVELWDPWTGAVKQLPVISQGGGFTEIALPLTEKEIQLIIFSPGEPILASKSVFRNPYSEIDLDGDWDFELQPTLDNRFGDFHWPPTRAHIGAEIRQLWYCEDNVSDGPWRKVTCTFGPKFMRYEGMPSVSNPLKHGGKPVEFSWRYGIENDPGHQGYHGLKAHVHNEFIAVGRRKQTWNGSNQCSYEDDGAPFFLWTTVSTPKAMTAYALTGELKPAKIWLNGAEVTGCMLKLKRGPNALVLNYDKPGRAYFVVSRSNDVGIEAVEPPLVPGEQLKFKSAPLAMHWWDNPDVLPFDIRPDEKNPVGWYRFTSPPGLCGMTMKARGKVQAWSDDKPMTDKQGSFIVAQVSEKPVNVLIRIEQERGFYGGAALLEPIRLDCGTGKIALGDWAKIDGLLSYSGGARYRKTVTIPESGKVVLDLGEVATSAEVRVNGKTAGVLVSPPWRLDITQLVELGGNSIEVLVHNTLANHYTTVPTSYRGETTSGLIGPVKLILSSQSN
ncbi:MAG: glycosylhydrolase-like jelly roll fold domain-containing protein, partial [Victivallales bacterium]